MSVARLETGHFAVPQHSVSASSSPPHLGTSWMRSDDNSGVDGMSFPPDGEDGKQGMASRNKPPPKFGSKPSPSGSNGAMLALWLRPWDDGNTPPMAVQQQLFSMESKQLATVFKELNRHGYGDRSFELFDWLRSMPPEHLLSKKLLDVWTYTAMVSLCDRDQHLSRASLLIREMRARNVKLNVHTFTTLMNVCIKSGNLNMALDTYEDMLREGCKPNVVTYNTLIDLYGKLGHWEKAVDVLSQMKAQKVAPVPRTYNTLIIACNTCNQPQAALAMYHLMLQEGLAPTATTYNTLISAYGKEGQLDKVLGVYEEMLARNCERSVITYSALISACEKAGRWEVALQLFDQMIQDGCQPNTITYNSFITACTQGCQWHKVEEALCQMQAQGLEPDIVTYTALCSAFQKGGEWLRALDVFEQVQRSRCRPDSIMYNAVIDGLWETGVVSAQRSAWEVFTLARQDGYFQQQLFSGTGGASAVLDVHALTAGVALLGLFQWLSTLKQHLSAGGLDSFPAELRIVTDKSIGGKEQANMIVKEAIAVMLSIWQSPFQPYTEPNGATRLQASGADVARWLSGEPYSDRLLDYYPFVATPAFSTPKADGPGSSSNGGRNDGNGRNQRPVFVIQESQRQQEQFIAAQVAKTQQAVQAFETENPLSLQSFSSFYWQQRTGLIQFLLETARENSVDDDIAHDAALLLDRTIASGCSVDADALRSLAAAALITAAEQSGADEQNISQLLQTLETQAGTTSQQLKQQQEFINRVLQGKLAAFSTRRCLKVYFERLGCSQLPAKCTTNIAGNSLAIATLALAEVTMLNTRPSVAAAAILYADRRARGVVPFWPSVLGRLTGLHNLPTCVEATAAIKCAQRLCQRIARPVRQVGISSPAAVGGSHKGKSLRSKTHSSLEALMSTLKVSAAPSTSGGGLGGNTASPVAAAPPRRRPPPRRALSATAGLGMSARADPWRMDMPGASELTGLHPDVLQLLSRDEHGLLAPNALNTHFAARELLASGAQMPFNANAYNWQGMQNPMMQRGNAGLGRLNSVCEVNETPMMLPQQFQQAAAMQDAASWNNLMHNLSQATGGMGGMPGGQRFMNTNDPLAQLTYDLLQQHNAAQQQGNVAAALQRAAFHHGHGFNDPANNNNGTGYM